MELDTQTRKALQRADKALRQLTTALEHRVRPQPTHRGRNITIGTLGAILASLATVFLVKRVKPKVSRPSVDSDDV